MLSARTHRGRELRGEVLDHRLMDEEAVGRDAGLAAVTHLGDHRPCDGGLDVGVVEDEERGSPPSSIEVFTTVFATSARSLRPVSLETVNETGRTRSSPRMVGAISDDRREGSTLGTPSGSPASLNSAAVARAVSGVSEAGFGVGLWTKTLSYQGKRAIWHVGSPRGSPPDLG
jgi:hypothetical protein